MKVHSGMIQSKQRYSKNVICLAVISTLLMSALPAVGQSSRTLIDDRDASLISLGLQDVLGNTRQRRRRRIPRLPSQPQAPNPSFRNPPSRQPQQPAPISPQEQQFLDSLSADEKQLYTVIQRAKKVLRQQVGADTLAVMMGMTPKGTVQTPQDLDREFQTILRESRASSRSEPSAKDGNPSIAAKPGNRLIHRLLNRRNNETYEQWHARIDPLVFATPGKEYEAWRSTLSSADKQAHDTLARNQRQRQSEEAGAILKDQIRRDLSCRWVPDPKGDGLDKIRVCDE